MINYLVGANFEQENPPISVLLKGEMGVGNLLGTLLHTDNELLLGILGGYLSLEIGDPMKRPPQAQTKTPRTFRSKSPDPRTMISL